MSLPGSFFGHPRGLATLFFTEMWERFSYYGMRAILVLFMTTPAAQEGLGLSVEESTAIYGLYTASVYLLTLPGGWIADNLLGQRKTVWYGGILIMFGHITLAIPGSTMIFYTGLALVACGTGMLKPNISTMVGELYPEGGARRDAGFSIFYMGINLGAFLGQILVSLLGEQVNWHLGFGLAAVGMLFGLIQYRIMQKSLGDAGVKPTRETKGFSAGDIGKGLALLVVLVLMFFVLEFAGLIHLSSARGLAEGLGVVIVVVTLVYFSYIFITGNLSSVERKQIFVIFLLFIGAALFWSGFEQAGSSLNLFARDYTDRFLFGYEIPAGSLQSVNAAFIIIFAPIVGSLWVKLAARNLNPNTPFKFGIGLILMGLGFLVMVFAARIVTTGERAGMGWLILTYFLHSIGELTLSPVGLSATTKLSPKRFVGQMMGIWFVGAALGNLIAGLFAGGFDPENVNQMPDLFMSVLYFGGASGLLFILFSPLIRKWMGGVK